VAECAICDDGAVTDTTTPADDRVDFDCPRCGQSVSQRFYSPCDRCREELRATMRNEPQQLEQAEYEPKMNVVPNQVATKE
jgi:predicted RNA-binding Zn-ribbon protein involved in translation (DUF1610 family)